MKASVIIPYRNRIDHLMSVLESLLDQTMKLSEYEIIVVDDGSSQPIESFLPSTIQSIRIPHSGAAAARNRGISAATGEILIFLDSDIVVEPSFVQSHCDFHQDHQKMVALGPRMHADPLGVVQTLDTRLKLLSRYGKTVSDLTHPWFMTYTCNVSLSRELALSELFDEHYKAWGLEDIEWAYRLYRRGCRFSFIEKMRSIHLYHDRTMTHEKFLGWEENLSYTLQKHRELVVLECFRDVFNPDKKTDYFVAYDAFERSVLCVL